MSRTLITVVVLLFTACMVPAQCSTGNIPCLTDLANNFPQFDQLQGSFGTVLTTRLSLQPGMEHQPAPGDPDVGRAAAWKTSLWDNVTIHVDATGSNTLQNQLNTAGTSLTKFQLTGVKFNPTAYIAYQVNIGQFIAGKRQSQAGHNLAAGRALYREGEMEKLRKAYASFEELRAEFLEKLASRTASQSIVDAKQRVLAAIQAEAKACEQKNDCEKVKAASALAAAEAAVVDAQASASNGNTIASSFLKMKIQALEVLSLSNYSESVVSEWIVARP